MNIQLISVPYDSALAHVRMGAGPGCLLNHGLATHLRQQGHHLHIHTIEADKEAFAAEIATSFQLQRLVAQQVHLACQHAWFPVILAGNCNTAVGILAGLNTPTLGVYWFDAHGDFNTPETTTGGFLDGMAVAMLTGRCWKQLTASVGHFIPVDDKNIALIGTRDLDPLEKELLLDSQIGIFSSQTVREQPIVLCGHFPSSVQQVYLHVDLDVLDPSCGKANSFAAPGGLQVEELIEILQLIKQRYRIAAIAFTAYDPSLDPDLKICDAVKQLIDSVLPL